MSHQAPIRPARRSSRVARLLHPLAPATAAALLTLVACGGGGGGGGTTPPTSSPTPIGASPTPTAVAASPTPTAMPTAGTPPGVAAVVVAPASLAFVAAGAAAAQTVTVTQTGNSSFSLTTSNCAGIVSLSAVSGPGPFVVTPVAAGICSYAVTGAGGATSTLSISVTTTSVGAQ